MTHGVTYEQLHMRKKGDMRKDAVIKKEMFEKHVKNNFNVCFIFDDRQLVVEMWREMGITCLQVAPGDF